MIMYQPKYVDEFIPYDVKYKAVVVYNYNCKWYVSFSCYHNEKWPACDIRYSQINFYIIRSWHVKTTYIYTSLFCVTYGFSYLWNISVSSKNIRVYILLASFHSLKAFKAWWQIPCQSPGSKLVINQGGFRPAWLVWGPILLYVA